MNLELCSAFSQQLACLIVMKVDTVSVFQNTIGQHIILIGAEMNDSKLMGGLESLVAAVDVDFWVGLS